MTHIYHVSSIRGCQWNLTKSIWKMRLSRGLICIRFRYLTNSNQCQIINFFSKNQSRASFWWFDKLQLFAVFGIWHIRSDFGSKFVKSSKRRTKKSSRESFWFVVLMIWQIRAKIGPILSNLQNDEQLKSVKSSKRNTWLAFRRENLNKTFGSKVSNLQNGCISGHVVHPVLTYFLNYSDENWKQYIWVIQKFRILANAISCIFRCINYDFLFLFSFFVIFNDYWMSFIKKMLSERTLAMMIWVSAGFQPIRADYGSMGTENEIKLECKAEYLDFVLRFQLILLRRHSWIIDHQFFSQDFHRTWN